MKYFVNYSGTKESFKDLEELYYKNIVFIEGSDLIYTHGHYYGDLKDAFEALKVEISDSINLLKEQVNTTDTDLYNNIDSLSNNLADNVDKLAKMITSNTKSILDLIDILVNADASVAINTFNEIISFLEGIENSEDLDSIIASIEQLIANINKSLEEHLTESLEIFITRSEVEDNYITKTEVANSYLVKGDYALKSEVEVEVEVEDGVYAVTADNLLIDYNIADSSCIGVALITANQRILISKSDATDGTNNTLYWGKNLYQKDVAGITETTESSVAKTDFNGKANTTAIIAAYGQHSVEMDSRDMCKVLASYTEAGFTDWYVPALGQLYEMYTKKSDINAALLNIGGTAFSEYYWSSSEYDIGNAQVVYFNKGNIYVFIKINGFKVRFVRDLIFKKPLKEKVSELETSISNVYSKEEIDEMFILSKYEFVDLGLPSGLKWASCNVGANTPEEYGLYFAWGETQGYSGITAEKQFKWDDYKLCNGSNTTLTKYNNSSSYFGAVVDNLTTLEQADDAAYVSDNTCRMPTHDDFQELIDNTTSTWETLNGVNGIRFTSKTDGNFIFVPAAGYCGNGSVYNITSFGFLWSSSLVESNSPSSSWHLRFDSSNVSADYYDVRRSGLSVRAVQEANISSKFDPSEVYSRLSDLENKISALELQIQELLTRIL